jgi:hypothetical protein
MNTSEILIGRWGKIVAGENVGFYVLVQDDTTGSTGGFYIFRGPRASLDSCWDNWVEKRDGVDQFFRFAGWQVEWLEPAT